MLALTFFLVLIGIAYHFWMLTYLCVIEEQGRIAWSFVVTQQKLELFGVDMSFCSLSV